MVDKSPPALRRNDWPDSASRPLVTPLQMSVVYASVSPDDLDAQYEGRVPGYTYAREGHPNADVLAARIDALEGAEGGIVVGSGMAAVTAAVLGLCSAGDHIIGGDQLYGRTLRMLREELPRYGITATLADPTDGNALAAAIRPETRMILVETVSNPTLRVADMERIGELARSHGILLVVDNTFTTPRGYRPFDHGADVVLHSVTKLLSGHSDTTLGYVCAQSAENRERLIGISATLGLTASPFDCWLAERGLMSFALRYDRAEENARKLADGIADLPNVRRVLYPTRPDHPDHNRAVQILGERGGNMVSFEIDGGRAVASALVRSLTDIAFAPTLGDISTILSHPATSSHRALTPEARSALGMSEGFFRISVGCEDPDHLIETFATAIRAAG